VSFFQLIDIATPGEKFLMYIAWFGALIAGAAAPLFAQFIKNMWNSFGATKTRE